VRPLLCTQKRVRRERGQTAEPLPASPTTTTVLFTTHQLFNNVRTWKGRQGARKGRRQAPQEGPPGQHPGHHKLGVLITSAHTNTYIIYVVVLVGSKNISWIELTQYIHPLLIIILSTVKIHSIPTQDSITAKHTELVHGSFSSSKPSSRATGGV
jgi:hypothetical protein